MNLHGEYMSLSVAEQFDLRQQGGRDRIVDQIRGLLLEFEWIGDPTNVPGLRKCKTSEFAAGYRLDIKSFVHS